MSSVHLSVLYSSPQLSVLLTAQRRAATSHINLRRAQMEHFVGLVTGRLVAIIGDKKPCGLLREMAATKYARS
jgi:hypothetical protein